MTCTRLVLKIATRNGGKHIFSCTVVRPQPRHLPLSGDHGTTCTRLATCDKARSTATAPMKAGGTPRSTAGSGRDNALWTPPVPTCTPATASSTTNAWTQPTTAGSTRWTPPPSGAYSSTSGRPSRRCASVTTGCRRRSCSYTASPARSRRNRSSTTATSAAHAAACAARAQTGAASACATHWPTASPGPSPTHPTLAQLTHRGAGGRMGQEREDLPIKAVGAAVGTVALATRPPPPPAVAGT